MLLRAEAPRGAHFCMGLEQRAEGGVGALGEWQEVVFFLRTGCLAGVLATWRALDLSTNAADGLLKSR